MTDSNDTEGSDVVEVPIDDWTAVVANLERFAGERGTVSETEGGLRCVVGTARFEVRRDGTVHAGMPLHDVSNADVRTLRFDHDGGAIVALAAAESVDGTGPDGDAGSDGGRFEYTFRRP